LIFKAWQKTSLIEYPGKLCTVLFVGGCNFRCPFCYNASLVMNPGAIPDLPAETALRYLAERRSLYQAAVVTGGEPTLNEELPSFFRSLKSLGFLGGLETNGSRPDMLRHLLQQRLVDFVAMDVKGPLETRFYRRAAGLRSGQADTVAAVRESLELLAEASELTVELRCTVVPGIHRPKELRSLGRELRGLGLSSLVLQQFQPERALDPALRRVTPFSGEALEALRRSVEAQGAGCTIRGL
jgi:pyruvate formate lyase activating enzyme